MPGKVLVMPRPNPKQRQALQERHRYVGYGGARGGGKSWFVRWKAVLLCLRYPGIKILITRRTYRELYNNHIAPLLSMLSGAASYNKGDKIFFFPNGSTISFGYCDADTDLGQYQGAEYDVWFADEAGQFPENWLTQIDACVRGTNPFPKRTYYTLNPGGPSHGYFKRLFIDRRFTEDEYPEDYAFIQALCTDNRALMERQPEYLRQLQKLPPKLRAAWLEGRWDVYEGQFFEEFLDRPEHYRDRRHTHVIAPFEIPENWKIYRSFDWGYHRPFSCGWWAVDFDGVAYRILELYGCTDTPNQGVRWTPEQVFSKIHRIESEHRWLRGKREDPTEKLMVAADSIREELGPMVPSSVRRCQEHNDELPGSAKNSRHIMGKAMDFNCPKSTQAKLEACLTRKKAAGEIRYWYRMSSGWFHFDVD